MKDKQYISTSEAAKILGISRIAIFNRIKAGKLAAKKVGRNFIIDRDQIIKGKDAELTDKEKAVIDKAVNRTLEEYSETLKLLSDA